MWLILGHLGVGLTSSQFNTFVTYLHSPRDHLLLLQVLLLHTTQATRRPSQDKKCHHLRGCCQRRKAGGAGELQKCLLTASGIRLHPLQL